MQKKQSTKLTHQMIEAINLLAAGDYNQRQVADVIGVTPMSISNWKKLKHFRDELDNVLQRKLDFAIPKAVQTMIELLGSKQDSIRYAAAKDILDRRGYKATDRVEHTGKDGKVIEVVATVAVLSDEEKKQLIQNAARGMKVPKQLDITHE